MQTNELLSYLFDGKPHLLLEPMATWLNSSRRFTTFVTDNQTKIRKKLRVVQEQESLRDLRLELETAYLLLQEKSFQMKYEPIHPELGRGPDFAVSFMTSLQFMVEVTRLRTTHYALPGDRLTDAVCSKLGQLMPQRSNVLIMGIDHSPPAPQEVQAAMLRLQQRAEGNDPAVVQRYEFRDRADFFRHYQRLSALLVRGIPLQLGEAPILWENLQAKHPLSSKVRTALLRSHTLR